MRGVGGPGKCETVQMQPLEPRRLLSAELVGSFALYPRELTGIGNELFYRLDTTPIEHNPHELHRTDGTPAGASRIRAAPGHTLPIGHYTRVARAGSTLFLYTWQSERQVWSINNRTSRATPLLPATAKFSGYETVALGNHLYFAATDDRGAELWRSDGTPQGTHRLADLNPGADHGSPHGFTVFNDRVYFSAQGANGKHKLWSTDGTQQGTTVVWPTPDSTPSIPGDNMHVFTLVPTENQLFFLGRPGADVEDFRVWVSNGTAAGTRPIFGDYRYPTRLVAVNSTLFFMAAHEGRDQFWVTDGVTARRLTELRSSFALSAAPPESLVSFNDTLIFSTLPPFASNDSFRAQYPDSSKLWKLQSSGRLTMLYDGEAQNLTVFQDKIFFNNRQGDLFVTDGTRQGTAPLNLKASSMAATHSSFYFAHEKQLWKLDPSRGDIRGVVWNDRDGNGRQLAGEEGLAGYRVYIDLNRDGRFSSGEPWTRTAADGSYRIAGLAPGNYLVRMTAVDGWQYTTESARTVLVQAAIGASFNFGLRGEPGSIVGTVYRDPNGNGRRDAGESGAAGFRVFIDRNRNGRFDAGEISTRSDADGRYRFENIPAGTYSIAVTPVELWAARLGWQRDVDLAPRQTASANFHLKPHIQIRGRVFYDGNANGTYEAGETPPLPVYQVYLDLNEDGQHDSEAEPTATVEFLGTFSFRPLATGTYQVRLVQLPELYRFTAPASGFYVVGSDLPRIFTGINFGLIRINES